MQWIDAYQAYVFDTGAISGAIVPAGQYPGIAGLMHREQMLNVVRPQKALMNPEYYVAPGSGTAMHPRWIASSGRVVHETRDGRVVLSFPPEPVFRVGMELTYAAHGDIVDMTMTLSAAHASEAFEVFFASYICEAFNETWVPLSGDDGIAWTLLDNRGNDGNCFAAARDDKARRMMRDGRWDEKLANMMAAGLEDRPFAMPLLIDRDAHSGMALLFLLDPAHTTLLGGQYHLWDTAHDWSFCADLATRRPVTMRARMVYRRLDDVSSMQAAAETLWQQFRADAPLKA